MKGLLLAAGLTLSVGALATAAILGPLRGMFHRARKEEAALDERERVRRALAPISERLDIAAWERWLGPLPEKVDHEGLWRRMPQGVRLSDAIIDEREEERRELGA